MLQRGLLHGFILECVVAVFLVALLFRPPAIILRDIGKGTSCTFWRALRPVAEQRNQWREATSVRNGITVLRDKSDLCNCRSCLLLCLWTAHAEQFDEWHNAANVRNRLGHLWVIVR